MKDKIYDDPKELAAFIGGRIKKRRKELGLTQSAVAELIGTGKSRWCDLEAGRKLAGIDNLFKIAAALECDVNDLLP